MSNSTIHIHLHVWRQPNTQTPGRLVDYQIDISPDTSFLEMLDLVNEDLVKQGQEPIAFDYDCREGICGTCGIDDQRPGSWPGPRRDLLPIAYAARSTMGTTLPSSRGGPNRSRSSRIWSSIAAISIASSRRADTSASAPAAPPTATRCRSPRRNRKRQWTRPLASAAGPVRRHAKTLRRCCSSRPR